MATLVMKDNHLYMSTFIDYPNWDTKTKGYALEILLEKYIGNYTLIVDVNQFVDELRLDIEKDIEYFESKEEYEICTILRDLKKAL